VPAIRINRALAAAGVASRRGAEVLIRAGRVQLNGQVVTDLAVRVDPKRDVLALDGRVLAITGGFHYYAYYKPRGVVCTMEDDRGRRCVGDVCQELPGRPVPVGRLDRASEGLLVLTDDGELANRLTHPRYRVQKRYLVTVTPALAESDAQQLVSRVELADGPARFIQLKLVQSTRDRSRLEVVVDEGRNRLVRRCYEALGYTVRRLKRLSVGGLLLGGLQPGQLRELSAGELKGLKHSAGR
jgi:23S rRNA pseudouridine2605 synthase